MRIALVYNLKRNESSEEAEFDAPSTIDAVQAALELGGHAVSRIPLTPISTLTCLAEDLFQIGPKPTGPDLVFNLAEGWSGPLREAQFPLLYESLGLPYTGPTPRALALTQDKHLTKLVVSGMQANVFAVPHHVYMRPDGEIAGGGAIDLLRGRKVIVKPSCAGSSQGITEKSICDFDWRNTAKRLLKRFPDGVLIEQFIVGYDVTVACAGGQVLPPVVFGQRASKKEMARLFRGVYTRTWKSTSSDLITAVPLKTGDKDRIQEIAIAILKETLGDLSFGRVDFRMTDDGTLYFLEVNGLPCLDRNAGSEWPEAEGVFPVAARAAEKTYEQVVLSIVDSAVKRFKIKGATK